MLTMQAGWANIGPSLLAKNTKQKLLEQLQVMLLPGEQGVDKSNSVETSRIEGKFDTLT